ncbi:MarR family winged helix-turn-helix transcriptional regulator [Rubrobacter indicoceani]|uniref:MarR family winged helix-turn-helix transcriptional regulator n=1 Tax=Rubrobacter indicoceani TaxID=2051957 RepID=UPI0019691A53|nr:MarR family winged helix-turn-helix transcriptional regulator [Rubrobacter indicoceani]
MVEEEFSTGGDRPAGESLLVPLGMAFWRMKVGFEREVGVSLGTWYTLRHLANEPGTTQGESGRRFNLLDPSRITRLAQRLERDGLISRERDSADSRVMRMYLTDAGRMTLTELGGAYRAFGAKFEAVMEPEEIDLLKRSLVKVARVAKEEETRKNEKGEK